MLYFLYSCISACTVTNCKECSDAVETCTLCSDGYYSDNSGDCSGCDTLNAHCDSCDPSDGTCTSCIDEYRLNEGGDCAGKLMTII